MVKMIKYRVYCGRTMNITSNKGLPVLVKDGHLEIFEKKVLAAIVPAWTKYDAEGAWNCTPERTVIYEILMSPANETNEAQMIADAYKEWFYQESVMITRDVVEVSF